MQNAKMSLGVVDCPGLVPGYRCGIANAVDELAGGCSGFLTGLHEVDGNLRKPDTGTERAD